MNSVLVDVLYGVFVGFKCFSFAYAVLLCFLYLDTRSKANNISYFKFCMLITPAIVLLVVLEENAKKIFEESTISMVAFFATAILGAITIISLCLTEYNRREK